MTENGIHIEYLELVAQGIRYVEEIACKQEATLTEVVKQEQATLTEVVKQEPLNVIRRGTDIVSSHSPLTHAPAAKLLDMIGMAGYVYSLQCLGKDQYSISIKLNDRKETEIETGVGRFGAVLFEAFARIQDNRSRRGMAYRMNVITPVGASFYGPFDEKELRQNIPEEYVVESLPVEGKRLFLESPHKPYEVIVIWQWSEN